MKTTIGGDRLGSGNKQTVDLKTYNRSTHDLGYLWRSTMASGTLVPFMSEVGLPGDTFDINLNCNVLTHPTIGPLFGSYKVQIDVFKCPIRLYQGMLHMNLQGIGLDMSKIKLPQLHIEADGSEATGDNEQINPSSLLSYLNIRGLGRAKNDTDTIHRKFNAVPTLAYWDIYKNYYANKQEEIGVVIHNPMTPQPATATEMILITQGGTVEQSIKGIARSIPPKSDPSQIDIVFADWTEGDPIPQGTNVLTMSGPLLTTVFSKWIWVAPLKRLQFWDNTNNMGTSLGVKDEPIGTTGDLAGSPQLLQFPLSNIDDMKKAILTNLDGAGVMIDKNTYAPYGQMLKENIAIEKGYSKLSTQEGLGIKTYQSDLFNNWVSTEWIDGDNGINSITAVDTSSGEFTMDTLNLSKKVYDMLNRIAISGGTYDDWLDAVYTHERMRTVESPVYMGGLIKEIVFQEVISNAVGQAEGVEQPLGTLAGRGVMAKKNKGGNVRVKVDEPSYIMGIISITPRVDYSQGNKWDTNLKTLDDFHKPALDEIGFQDLVTDQMAWFDTLINNDNVSTNTVEYKSAGKQPAWVNYMTNVNQVRGNFADKDQQMFMTLNRRYEQGAGGINDLTTYIDPSKFNHIFADTRIDAQNFWAQIGVDITARRKMSSKIMPNL